MKGLTKRQREILEFIKGYITTHQYSPSYREIMEHFGFSSLGSVYKHISILKRKGALTSEDKCSRSLAVTPEPTTEEMTSEITVPLIGHISSAFPIETFPRTQTVQLPRYLSCDPDRTYVLRARGDSLSDEYIADGDLVVVEARSEARPGEFVVATVNHQETVVKRYYPEGQYVRLEGNNPHQQSVIIRNEDLTVQGVMIGLLRLY